MANTDLFLSAVLSSGVIYSRRKRSGFIFGFPAFHRSLTQSPAGDAGSAVAARARRVSALRPPHSERSHQRCPASPGPRWSSAGPAGPGPTLPPPLPGPSHAHAGRGSPGTSWRSLCGRAAAAPPPSPSSSAPQEVVVERGTEPGAPSCPTSGAAGPLSTPGKSSRLRVGHQGLPWVVAWLKGET